VPQNRTLVCALARPLSGWTIAFTLPGVNMHTIRDRHGVIEDLPGVDHVIDRNNMGYVPSIKMNELPGTDNDTLFVRVDNQGFIQPIVAEILHLFDAWFGEELVIDTSGLPMETLDLLKSSIGGKPTKRRLVCCPTPKRINANPSFSVVLPHINTESTQWLQKAIMYRLTTMKKGGDDKPPIKNTKGVKRIYGSPTNPDVIIVEVRMINVIFKTAGRVHSILQKLLDEELELDRSSLRPNASQARIGRAMVEAHRLPAPD